MNFEAMIRELSDVRQVIPIGRSAEVEGVLLHVVGFWQNRAGERHLEVLSYDEPRAQLLEKVRKAGLEDEIEHPATWRAMLENEIRYGWNHPLNSVQTISLGPAEFRSSGYSGSNCAPENWRGTARLTHFLDRGWSPAGLEGIPTERLYRQSLDLRGGPGSLIELDAAEPMRFLRRPKTRTVLQEEAVALEVGDLLQTVWMAETGVREQVNVLRVELVDPWEDHGAWNPERERAMEDLCPRGMRLPAIFYECRGDLTPQFHTRISLKDPVKEKSCAIGFVFKEPCPQGTLNVPVRTAILEPVPPETDVVDTELFSWERKVPQQPIWI